MRIGSENRRSTSNGVLDTLLRGADAPKKDYPMSRRAWVIFALYKAVAHICFWSARLFFNPS